MQACIESWLEGQAVGGWAGDDDDDDVDRGRSEGHPSTQGTIPTPLARPQRGIPNPRQTPGIHTVTQKRGKTYHGRVGIRRDEGLGLPRMLAFLHPARGGDLHCVRPCHGRLCPCVGCVWAW